MTMKAILRSTCITYRAHFKTCQRPTFCKVLCTSFLEVSVQAFFFQVPEKLISFGFNLSQYFSHCKNQFDYSTFWDPILCFFKLLHSYLIAFRQTLEGTQDLTSSHMWKTSALLKGHKEMQPFHFVPN